MTIKEIYVLNRALDGKDIFSLPKLSQMKISNLLVSAVKKNLIKKGYLQANGFFTDIGLSTVNRLKKYKEAKKYIIINNVSIGVINSTDGVVVIFNKLNNDYKIIFCKIANLIDQIIETFEFLSFSEKNDKYSMGEGLNSEELELSIDNYEQSEDSFKLIIDDNGSFSEELYFYESNNLFVYDYLKRELFPKTKSNMIQQLSERVRFYE